MAKRGEVRSARQVDAQALYDDTGGYSTSECRESQTRHSLHTQDTKAGAQHGAQRVKT
jgi:hypothetical protein